MRKNLKIKKGPWLLKMYVDLEVFNAFKETGTGTLILIQAFNNWHLLDIAYSLFRLNPNNLSFS